MTALNMPSTGKPKPERKPGDFHRTAGGAPKVSDPSKPRQPKGNKPELIAKCEALGLPTEGTVAELRERLGTEPGTSTYKRPSGYAVDPDTYNLQKWNERCLVRGMADLTTSKFEFVSVLELAGDLEDDKSVDRVAADAKVKGGSEDASNRGTHVHLLTELTDSGVKISDQVWADGETLGIPKALQQRIVQQWVEFRRRWGLTALAIEVPIVNDEYRAAGTADRADTSTFELAGIPAGQPFIGDIKTGAAHAGADGTPAYWSKYSVQLEIYAGGVPYDPDRDVRLTWAERIGHERLHLNTALIYHYDLPAALDGEPTDWQIIPIDLAAGRRGADLAVQLREWAASPGVGAPLVHPDKRPETFDEVGERLVEMFSTGPTIEAMRERWADMAASAARTGWADHFNAIAAEHAITKESTVDEIKACLDAMEPPFDEQLERVARTTEAYVPPPALPQPDEGGTCSPDAIEAFKAAYMALTVDARTWIGELFTAAQQAGVPFHLKEPEPQSVRRFEILRGLTELARSGQTDDDMVRAVCAVPLGDLAYQPVFAAGAVVGALGAAEAAAFAQTCIDLAGDTVSLVWEGDRFKVAA